jgi:hypothetical protein
MLHLSSRLVCLEQAKGQACAQPIARLWGEGGSGREIWSFLALGGLQCFKYLLQGPVCLLYSALRLSGRAAGQANTEFKDNADNQSIGSNRTQEVKVQVQGAGFGAFPVSTGGLHPGHDPHAQEAEFGDAQGGQGASDQWV